MSKYYVNRDIISIVRNLNDYLHCFENKTILITGAGGFLGRYFIAFFNEINKLFFENSCKVLAYDNFITAKDNEGIKSDENIHFFKKNVCDKFEINEKVDYIIHLAGIASPYYYRAYPLETIDVAINGTRNMLDLAKEKNAKILYFSSSEIYGDPDPRYIPTPESYRGYVSCLDARACYDESKRMGETLCKVYASQFGVHANMVRPFNVYGPGMGEKDYRVLPNFAFRILNDKHLQIYGSGNQTRTFCYISDAITGFLLVLLRGVIGEAYNIGNPKPEISMIDLTKFIKKYFYPNIVVDIIDYPDSYPADEPNRRCPDITKAIQQLDFDPKIDLQLGLKNFFEWASANYSKIEKTEVC